MSHTTHRGRAGSLTRREREAIAKVRAWHSWQEAGGDPKQRPPRPSRADFAIAQRCER